MSLVPLFSDFDSLNDVEQLLEDSFGLGLNPIDIFRPRPQRSLILQPRCRYCPYIVAKCQSPTVHGKLNEWKKSELVPQVNKDGFQVCMDVSQFKPNELTVKTADRTVTVEGKHEERQDEHGFIQRHFVRKYTLPEGYDSKDVISTISSDGVLTVKAPPPPSKTKHKNERVVQIQQTGLAHLNVKQAEHIQNGNQQISNAEAEKMETK